jgi:hypothetical protein
MADPKLIAATIEFLVDLVDLVGLDGGTLEFTIGAGRIG